MRPIAIGCTLRRLAAKVASNKALKDIATLLEPHHGHQLAIGYGVKGGAEAAVHSARLFLHNLKLDQALLKLNFKNAFNSVRRDKMLSSVLDLAPDIFPFVYSAYSLPFALFWGDKSLQSSEGLQQGDPLGPLLFCLSLYQLHSQMKSEFHVLYLDDVTLGGNLDDVVHDLVLFDRVVWDATCPDTFAPSYTAWATSEPGAVAALAEEKKRDKYAHLDPSHSFTPVAVETSGAIGPKSLAFLKDLGRRLRQVTGEDRAFSHLLQRVAVAVQRGNPASVMGTTGLMDYSFEFS